MSLQYTIFKRSGGRLPHMGDMKYSYSISVENPARRRPLAIWEDKIKSFCKKCVNVKWIQLSQRRVQWLQSVANNLITFRFHKTRAVF
jgi:hypothetical protein